MENISDEEYKKAVTTIEAYIKQKRSELLAKVLEVHEATEVFSRAVKTSLARTGDVRDIPINDLQLNNRTKAVLVHVDIKNLGELVIFYLLNKKEMMEWRNFGDAGMVDVEKTLRFFGFI